MKQFKNLILAGALVLGLAGFAVSCDKYGDDIDSLQTQVDAIKADLQALQAKVDAGKYVTNVSKSGDGIVITWNDNSTSTIETIKGDKGEKGDKGDKGDAGAAGTVVTIVDGYWAFDGVKSEYPAAGPKGESGADGHDAKISEDGYWMIWDTEKGAYVTTTYVVAPVSATQNPNGSWTITVTNADGTTSSINIPTMVLASIEVDQSINKDMTYWYGVVNQDVKWGWNGEETMNAGFYSKLNQNLLVLLNPAGVHGDSYAYTLKNSNGDEAPVTFFKTAVPYTGAALTKATSSNGLWVLPAEITVKPAADIEALRRELYLSFKVNDGNAYRLALEAADEQGNTVRTEYDNTVTLGAATAKKGTQTVVYEKNCLIGKTYYPEFLDEYGSQIYKYKMRLTQTAQNLRYAEVFGATVTEDGQGYLATKEAGIFNEISYDICGVYINGTTFTATIKVWFTNEMTADRSWTIEAINKKPLDADKVDLSTFTDNYIKGQLKNSAEDLFVYTYTYNLTEKIAELSDTEKLVWNEAIAKANIKSLRDGQELYINGLIGGEGENNATNRNELMNKHMSWSINPTTNVLTVKFYVSPDWEVIGTTPAGSRTVITAQDANFKLNNAYQLTLYVVDPENPTMNVAEIVLPFEFTMPTLDITTDTGNFTQWTTDKDGEEYLVSYGAYYNSGTPANPLYKMHVPLYEAFKAWTKEYTKYDDNAKYYNLYKRDNADDQLIGITSIGKMNAAPLDDNLKYSTTWKDWTTWTTNAKAGDENAEWMLTVGVDYAHYGVYHQDLFTGGKTSVQKDNQFVLRFASLLNHSTLKMAAGKETLIVNTGTHDVFISNDDLDLTTPKGGKFFLFDGLDKNENVVLRKTLNETSFNEEQRPFMTVDDIFAFDGNRYAINFKAQAKNAKDGTIPYNIKIVDPDRNPVSGYDWVYDVATGKRTYTLPAPDPNEITIYRVKAVSKMKASDAGATGKTNATLVSGHTGGMVIQLPTSVADQEEVEITLTVEDGLGFTNDLKFTVKKIK